MPVTADTIFGVCNVSSVWTVECIFSKFLLDGIPANAVGFFCWRGWSRVSVHMEKIDRPGSERELLVT